MSKNFWERLAVPGVSTLIAFLAYGSQILFRYTEPHPLEPRQVTIFNALVACIWITYARACFINPGWVPSGWNLNQSEDRPTSDKPKKIKKKQKWCRKCDACKPPRAHHCKLCQRCVPKMDHHCPWTANCVSHRTFPHFFRFLYYAVTAMSYLEYFLYIRAAVIWNRRNLPSYLGPSPTQLIFLFIFLVVNSVTLFALAILLARNIWCLGGNVTTIEGWEIERHETLVRRARALGGYLDGPDGTRIRIAKQEFPYDIGILQNMRQGMDGTPLLWLWPFAATPSNESGLEFETNSFEDALLSWPPPDPDRIPVSKNYTSYIPAFTHVGDSVSTQDHVDAFRRRQHEDLKRFDQGASNVIRRQPFRKRYGTPEKPYEPLNHLSAGADDSGSGEEGWRDNDGDRLDDFGVDEDAEFYDEDDIPLAELIRKRRETVGSGD